MKKNETSKKWAPQSIEYRRGNMSHMVQTSDAFRWPVFEFTFIIKSPNIKFKLHFPDGRIDEWSQWTDERTIS